MRPTIYLALVATVLGVPSACEHRPVAGHAPASAVTIAALHDAPAALTRVGSGRFEMHLSIDGPESSRAVRSFGVFSGGALAMDIDLEALMAQIAQQPDRPIPDGLDTRARVIIHDTTAYVRIPMLHELTGEPGWLSLSSTELGERGSVGFAATALNPVRLVDTLRGVVGDVQEVGREEVRGVSTTHVTSTLLTGQSMDVWVDAEQLVRRLRVVVDDTSSELGIVTTTVELFDFGATVDIDVPGPGEFTPFSDLIREFMVAGA
ncbi:MAG: hypothetical protein WD691_07960 [Acidimicrobiales bacterium]